MHPNTFLRTFWQLELKRQVFVAMSFAPEYRVRYEKVLSPAISSVIVNGTPLQPCRVDISKSGDSILTDIIEGVSHSQMVLADVSSVGKDSKTGESYRNGNVMYEIGLALACRHPSDVLLVTMTRTSSCSTSALFPTCISTLLILRKPPPLFRRSCWHATRQQNYFNDARVKIAVASLSNQEIELLAQFAELPEGQAQGGTWEEQSLASTRRR